MAALAITTVSTPALFAAPGQPIKLWPGKAPGDKDPIGEEKDMTKPTENKVGGKPLIRLGKVSEPTITFYPASKEKNTGAAVLVCPGGGYNILAYDLEGSEVCEWFNSIGVNAVLVKYRVPKRPGTERHAPPLQDVQRAMGIVRSKAAEWGIDEKRIGILGFSAGGHLAAVASNNYEQRTYEKVDAADELGCRPDFSILIYPAYLTVKEQGDKLAPELPVSAKTPPTFLAMTEDDGVRVESALFYYLALKNAKVPAEMHLYPTGGHGYGLRPSQHMVTTWPKRVEEWMTTSGLLQKTGK
ncbi:MAG: alpha/beta hydrolase [Verrucomicrobiota bacterium]